MSISLALVPVALALRAVMGKDRFDSWVKSLQVRVPTDFKDEADLLLTVRKAGYDADRFGGAIKTHVRGEEFYFFWELVDGVWTAVFAKSDTESDIKRFIRELERKSARRVFRWADGGQKVSVLPAKTFPTNFRDPELLMAALAQSGLAPVRASDGGIRCRVQDCRLMFRQVADAPFTVQVRDGPDIRQVFEHLANIDSVYGRNVQARACENVKSRASARGLSLESEEQLDDGSVLITLTIQR
ncbi:MAG: hypothetical protein ACREHD_14450 [Pirellulales bacterium]